MASQNFKVKKYIMASNKVYEMHPFQKLICNVPLSYIRDIELHHQEVFLHFQLIITIIFDCRASPKLTAPLAQFLT